jgi:hypothetical protein
MIPIPAAPIPCCALPVPIKPPAIAIAAAIANKGFVKPALVAADCANAGVVKNVESAIVKPAIIMIEDNFERLFSIIMYGSFGEAILI